MSDLCILQKYEKLAIDTDVVIRFFDGTVIKGIISAIQNDIISVSKASVYLPHQKHISKYSAINIHANAFYSLIYAVPVRDR